MTFSGITIKVVALLAEGVDRNVKEGCRLAKIQLSPSSQRAWIEIASTARRFPASGVALLAEGVDRNKDITAGSGVSDGRPPRRGRG